MRMRTPCRGLLLPMAKQGRSAKCAARVNHTKIELRKMQCLAAKTSYCMTLMTESSNRSKLSSDPLGSYRGTSDSSHPKHSVSYNDTTLSYNVLSRNLRHLGRSRLFDETCPSLGGECPLQVVQYRSLMRRLT